MPLLCASFSVAAASPPEIATPAVFFKKKKTAKSVKASLDIFKKNLLSSLLYIRSREKKRERERERVNEKIFFWSKPKRKGNEVKESF